MALEIKEVRKRSGSDGEGGIPLRVDLRTALVASQSLRSTQIGISPGQVVVNWVRES